MHTGPHPGNLSESVHSLRFIHDENPEGEMLRTPPIPVCPCGNILVGTGWRTNGLFEFYFN